MAHALQAEAAKKDAEIQALQAKLAASDVVCQLAVNQAVGVVAQERDALKLTRGNPTMAAKFAEL